ncbi:uncharacterized protein PAC_09028 [Phialocephala subalpina]|uniref:Uncharacterized protein n=1 Tax=Phialocephala subalpina TaxID=576137 RepID=A0A1L7X279_9HELO|nr:uncharacterized protein PAC_09028 [Phialocephala subalpina]
MSASLKKLILGGTELHNSKLFECIPSGVFSEMGALECVKIRRRNGGILKRSFCFPSASSLLPLPPASTHICQSSSQATITSILPSLTPNMYLPFLSLLTTIVILFLSLSLISASPTTINSHTPTPTYPFTLAAFFSPYTPGTNGSVSGIRVRASEGSFWVNASNQKPAVVDSEDPQQVYLDTRTGVLGYTTSVSNPSNTLPPSAMLLNFLRLGRGTSVTSTIPGEPGFYNAGPGLEGTFNWIGSENDYWFLCSRPGPGYQVMKYVGGTENWDLCLSGIQLVALDWAGSGPAAGEYL